MKRLSIALLACLATSVAGAAGAPVVRGGGNGIFHSPPLNHDVQQTFEGTTLNFVSGAVDDTGPISGDWDINFWDDDGFALFLVDTYNVEAVVDGDGNAMVLQPGDTVGAASAFSDTGATVLTSDAWLAGVDGYLGVKFDCDGRLANPVPGPCFGYVHIITDDTAGAGFPATIVEYSYDGDGNDIVVAPAGPPVPSAAKSFAPSSVGTGATSTLTITLTNPTATAAALTADLVDTFPTGLVVAATPNASTTCGGALTANAGGGAVTLASAGSTIPASGACAIAVDVTSDTAGSYANTIPAGALQTDQGDSAIAANATLVVSGAPSATVTPPSLTLTAPADGSDTATLNIANAAGGSDLTFAITAQSASRPLLRPHLRSHGSAKKTLSASLNPIVAAKLYGKSLRSPASFGASHQAHRVTAPWAPAGSIQFQLDDGTAETAISLNDGSTQTPSAYINRFAVTAGTGAFTIDSISIFWPDTDTAGGDLTGKEVNLLAYYDADGDGDPSNAVRLGTDTLVEISQQGAVETYTTNFSVPGEGDVYIGFEDSYASSPVFFSTAMDTDSSQHSSYVAGNPGAALPPDLDNLGNNEALGVIDDITGGGLTGNWVIRATGTNGGTGPCTGEVVPWLTASPSGGTVAGGEDTDVTIRATPADGSLAPGAYTAELCIATNDPAQPVITIPVSLTVTQGAACSAADTIFCNGFDGSGGGDDVVTGTIGQAVTQDGDGSSFDFTTGDYHPYDPGISTDDINLYYLEDPASGNPGLFVYWYGDAVPPEFADLVGGVVVTQGGFDFAVLHSGDTVGPDSFLSAASISMDNWFATTDGYIGVAFYNEGTGVVNYGYIHMSTTSPEGFPAQVLDYGYNSVGNPITIP